ncbi:hypothetical protein GOBAR_DD17779 [Gossypium barbadense]|nr:hypothetical protein GOBAR_DD17779 [Gossypium barbadense]
MEWRSCYLDMVLVPLSLAMSLAYHWWLWRKVRSQPLTTIIGTNARGRRFWAFAIMKDNEKKNIVAVQTLRNTIMGSTLMATTSILLCAGLAAVISSTYSIKRPLNDSIFGAHGEFMVSLKYGLKSKGKLNLKSMDVGIVNQLSSFYPATSELLFRKVIINTSVAHAYRRLRITNTDI